MTGFETRITALEDGHRSNAEALLTIQEQLATLLALMAADGGVSVVVRDRRVKFSGSLPIPWTLTALGSIGAGIGVLTKLLGAW